MEILKKNENEMPEIKNTVIKMKNAFNGLISSLDMIEIAAVRCTGDLLE